MQIKEPSVRTGGWFTRALHSLKYKIRTRSLESNSGSRLCRPTCGGGSAPPFCMHQDFGAMPLFWGAAPDAIRSGRKGIALPHIGRQSRKEFSQSLPPRICICLCRVTKFQPKNGRQIQLAHAIPTVNLIFLRFLVTGVNCHVFRVFPNSFLSLSHFQCR
jgi:hypothetical protein